MPNWPPDFDMDSDDDFDRPRTHTHTRRASVIRTPEQRKTKTWNGNPVSSMESDHIMNSILFCERKFVEAKHNHQACFYGQEVELFYFQSVYDMFPEYVNLRDEWKRRLKND